MSGRDAGADCDTGSLRNRTASHSFLESSGLGESARLRSKVDDRDQMLEGGRIQNCKRTNGFLAILNTWRLAENLHFSWLEGKVRDKVVLQMTHELQVIMTFSQLFEVA